MNTLWVVTPVYFDGPSLDILRVRIRERLPLGSRLRFVVVDDSAGVDQDLKERLARWPAQDLLQLTPPFNLGHQRAIVFGLRTLVSELAPGDLVVTMDSDGED